MRTILAIVLLFGFGIRFYFALRTGTVQRCPGTPVYRRSDDPCLYWLLVSLLGFLVVVLAYALTISCLGGAR